jgi:PDDEXK-like domain of unknown function (DUF3799)
MPGFDQQTVWTKGSISKPGIYSNIPLDTYHRADMCDGVSVSSSGLRTIFAESPAHYWCGSPLNPRRIEKKVPRHFVLGRAMHHLAMGEADFAHTFCETPSHVRREDGEVVKWSGRTNEAKRWLDARRQEGRIPLEPDEIVQIKGMTDALKSSPFVVENQILDGWPERSAFCQDKETGFWLKVRPDVIPNYSGDFVDLKTCASVLWPDLLRTVAENGYHMQFALMREVFRRLDMPFRSATLLFIEKEPPHCIRVVNVRTEDLDRGERQNRSVLRVFARCWERWTKTGDDRASWPGPGGFGGDAETLALPEWYRDQSDKRMTAFAQEYQDA